MTDVTQSQSALSDIAAKILTGEAGSAGTSLDIGSLLGNMSMTIIVINIIAGLVGSAYFMYGKKRSNVTVMCCGIALCVVPYFISNSIMLVVACLAMAAAPFII